MLLQHEQRQTVTQRIGQIPDAHFLRKPYGANDLVAVLDDALQRSSAGRPHAL